MVTFIACIVIVVLVAVLVYAGWKIENLQLALESAQERHALCHEQTSELLTRMHSNDTRSTVLREMAEKYDDPGNQPLLRRLAQEEYVQGGTSIPALWMRTQADQIDFTTDQIIQFMKEERA